MISNIRLNIHNKYVFDAKFQDMVYQQRFTIESYDKNLNQILISSKNRFGYLGLSSGLLIIVFKRKGISKDFLDKCTCCGLAKICIIKKEELGNILPLTNLF